MEQQTEQAYRVTWTSLARLMEPGVGLLGDGCELVLEYRGCTSVLAVAWLEADDQPWRCSVDAGSWLDLHEELASGEAATLGEAQAAAANYVRGELVKIAAALEALAGKAVPS